MSRSPDNEVIGMDLRVTIREVEEKGWQTIFSNDARAGESLVVEIGFGRGEFLEGLARNNLHKAHVGIDLSWKRVTKMARRLASRPIRNLRLIQGDAKEVMLRALDNKSVETFWINFPDPWPKRRHSSRRFIQRDVLDALVQKLIPNGTLEVATDHPGYANWINERLKGTKGLENLVLPKDYLPSVPGRHRTAYEEIWISKGRALFFWRYKRVET